MSFESGLVDKLTTDVAAISGRVFPQYLPQDEALPAVTYRLVSDPELDASDGPTGLMPAVYILTVWAETYASMKAVSAACRASLAGFIGDMDGQHVSRLAWLGGPETFDNNTPDGDNSPGVHRHDVTLSAALTGV